MVVHFAFNQTSSSFSLFISQTSQDTKITGMPNSKFNFINWCVVESQIYSKCMVEPLIKTPIGIMASNGLPNLFVFQQII